MRVFPKETTCHESLLEKRNISQLVIIVVIFIVIFVVMFIVKCIVIFVVTLVAGSDSEDMMCFRKRDKIVNLPIYRYHEL